jgi:hypothetical protein
MSLKPIPSPAELRSMTPPQVDEYFADVYDEDYRLRQERGYAMDAVRREAGARQDYGSRMWSMTFAEALDKLKGADSRALRDLAEAERRLKKLPKDRKRCWTLSSHGAAAGPGPTWSPTATYTVTSTALPVTRGSSPRGSPG